MEYKKIEETRIYFMEKYGVPSEQKFGNMTYKVVNHDLDSFDRLIKSALKCCELTKFTNPEDFVNVICDFSKDLDPVNMNIIADKLEKIAKDLSKGINFSRSGFVKLVQELSKDSKNDSFEINKVMNYFVTYLNVKPASYKIKTSRRRVDNQGDSYWRRNKGLEDNNY